MPKESVWHITIWHDTDTWRRMKLSWSPCIIIYLFIYLLYWFRQFQRTTCITRFLGVWVFKQKNRRVGILAWLYLSWLWNSEEKILQQNKGVCQNPSNRYSLPCFHLHCLQRRFSQISSKVGILEFSLQCLFYNNAFNESETGKALNGNLEIYCVSVHTSLSFLSRPLGIHAWEGFERMPLLSEGN